MTYFKENVLHPITNTYQLKALLEKIMCVLWKRKTTISISLNCGQNAKYLSVKVCYT